MSKPLGYVIIAVCPIYGEDVCDFFSATKDKAEKQCQEWNHEALEQRDSVRYHVEREWPLGERR